MIAGSHITELHTHEYEEPLPPELLNVVPNEPQTYDSAQNYQLDSSKMQGLDHFIKNKKFSTYKRYQSLKLRKSRLLQSK